MTQIYMTNYCLKIARQTSKKSLKMFSTALMVVLLSAASYGQCITGGNSTETIGYTGGFFGGVTNSTDAIDADFVNTAATLSITGAFANATMAVNFSKPVNPGDSVYFIIGQGTSLNISLLGSLTGTAYTGKATSSDATGGTAIGSNSASNFLSLLFIGGTPYQALAIGIDPKSTTGASSITLVYSALVAVGSSLDVYGVYVVPGPPTAINQTVCYPGGIANLQASKQTIGNSTIDLKWYASPDTNGTVLKSDIAKSGSPYVSTYTTPTSISSTKTFYVRQSTSGCGLYSPLVPVTATINPQILAPITLSCTSTGTNKGTKLTVVPSGGSGTLATISWAVSNGGTVTANGTTTNPTIGSNGIYTATVTDSKGCSKTQSIIVNGYSASSCGTVVLPALGLALGGSVTTGKPVLTWSTLQEVNTSYYSIEASTDGTNFATLGKVAAAGNSSAPSNYTFTDVTSTGAIVYYRVKLVDIDGGIAYSNVFTLRLSGSSFAKVYPNPVTNFVNIETGAAGTYITELFTIDGRKVISTLSSTASGLVTFTINRSNVTSGVYLLKVTNKSTAGSTYNTIMVQ